LNKTRIAEALKHSLPLSVVSGLRWIDRLPIKLLTAFNSHRQHLPVTEMLLHKRKLHLGCGFNRLPNFVNIDCQATSATDCVMDCGNLSWLTPSSCDEVYAHAFLEHLPPEKILSVLRNINRALSNNGICVILGIPDFYAIANAYLQKDKGNTGKIFDLREVYRYTHGDPGEIVNTESYLAQLHKTLFDVERIVQYIDNAGFAAWRIVRYCWNDEPNAVSLGFMSASYNRLVTDDMFINYLRQNTPFVRRPHIIRS
jgi:predicted SAM-dependent methyltransferase